MVELCPDRVEDRPPSRDRGGVVEERALPDEQEHRQPAEKIDGQDAFFYEG